MSKSTPSHGIRTIEFEGSKYPLFQSEGFAAQYAFPFAEKVCTGLGFDIGCMKEEWKLPGSIAIDVILPDEYHAMNLPFDVNFIFSSHCLEHIPEWTKTLDYWTSKLKKEGVLFLYLPDYSQKYWRPWNNRKHCNIFTPQIITDYLQAAGYYNIFASGVDLYNSFMVMAEKI